MSLKIIKPGLQTTLQGAPFSGHRHIGMPAAGAADCLSLAIANFSAGKKPDAIAVEITLDEAQFIAQQPCMISVSGAADLVKINNQQEELNRPLTVKTGDVITIAAAKGGCRSYLAINKSLFKEYVLENGSTYMAAGLGGFFGRALRKSDILEWQDEPRATFPGNRNVEKLRLRHTGHAILRVTAGPEWDMLDQNSITALCGKKFTVSNRANRMGLELNGFNMRTKSAQNISSAPVFPGTIQCPPNGQPFLLGPDAQTTGGYPRIAQVIKADRHLIGQLRTGSRAQFIRVSPEKATDIYREKLALLRPLLGNFSLW